MGDRANVLLKQEGTEIYLYTHSAGTELPEIVRNAMARSAAKNRYDDPAYLNRIIFSYIIKDVVFGETGFGISPRPLDGEDRIIVIDHDLHAVYHKDHRPPDEQLLSFEDFANKTEANWFNLKLAKAQVPAKTPKLKPLQG